MATNYNNTQNDSYTGTVDTGADRKQLMTGVISQAANAAIITGVGTLFTSEFRAGDYVFNNSDELRQITSIYSDTLMYVNYPFTVALVSVATYKVKASRWIQIGVACISGTPTVNGIAMVAGQSLGWGSMQDTNYVCDPIIIDTSGGGVVALTKFTKG